MSLQQSDMTPEQIAAVEQAMVRYLEPRDYKIDGHGHTDEPTVDPVRPGVTRHSDRGSSWITFAADPDAPRAIWYRSFDMPAMDDIPAYDRVLDHTGAVLGASDGPLQLTMIRSRPYAMPINTGWNYGHEIIWVRH